MATTGLLTSLPTNYFTFTPLNEEARFDHGDGCKQVGESADWRGRLYVTRNQTGWYWYCHNCGQRGYRRYTTNDLIRGVNKGMLNEQLRVSKQPTKEFDYAQYFSNKLSPAATEWLYRYDISDDEIEWAGIKSDNDEVLLPIRGYHGNDLGYQIRNLCSINVSMPKYITRYKGGGGNVHEYSGAWFRRQLDARVLVIVEDILSAIKCSRPYYMGDSSCRSCDSLALLSSPSQLPRYTLTLPLKYDLVCVWLDSDKSHYAMNYCNTFRRIMGINAIPIYTEKDPKEYTTEEIHDRTLNHSSLTEEK